MRDEFLRRRPRELEPEARRPPTRAYADLKAMALLAQSRMAQPPVDIEWCAVTAGIRLISYDRLGGQSALLSVIEGIPVMIVERDHPRTRQRFSIAHEIGHWVLERAPLTHELQPIAARGREYTALERVCDHFAVALLMPWNWMRDRVAIGMTAGELAKAFEVSDGAMSRRMRELGLATQRGRIR